MTRKQMKKLAQEIYDYNEIHDSSEASQQEKSRAEKRIMQITGQILSLKDGMNLLLEIDELVQAIAKNNK